jgi:hypothetical protein
MTLMTQVFLNELAFKINEVGGRNREEIGGDGHCLPSSLSRLSTHFQLADHQNIEIQIVEFRIM